MAFFFLVLEMLNDVIESNNTSDAESVSSEVPAPPPVKSLEESLRRKLLKKRHYLSKADVEPRCNRILPKNARNIEIIALGDFGPSSREGSSKKTNVEGLISGTFTPQPQRRRLSSVSAKTDRPQSACIMPDSPLSQDLKDSMSVDDIRIEKARIITEYLSGDEGRHLLHENKGMADSIGR